MEFFSFQNNPKNLDPSYKMDLNHWDCLGRVKLILTKCQRTDLVICSNSREGKTLSYNRRNTVLNQTSAKQSTCIESRSICQSLAMIKCTSS